MSAALALFGRFEDGDMAALSAARERVGFPPVTPVVATPGAGLRVLAFREEPNFLCDYRVVLDPQDTSEMGRYLLDDALHWVLAASRPAVDGKGYADVLTRWMGAEVREVHDLG